MNEASATETSLPDRACVGVPGVPEWLRVATKALKVDLRQSSELRLIDKDEFAIKPFLHEGRNHFLMRWIGQ